MKIKRFDEFILEDATGKQKTEAQAIPMPKPQGERAPKRRKDGPGETKQQKQKAQE